MVEYELYIYKFGRKIPSPPDVRFMSAKNTQDLRMKLLKKYSAHHQGSRAAFYGSISVFHKNGNAIVAEFRFSAPGYVSPFYGPYVWEIPKNRYNGKKDTYAVNPITGKLR